MSDDEPDSISAIIGPKRDLNESSLTEADRSLIAEFNDLGAQARAEQDPTHRNVLTFLHANAGIRAVELLSSGAAQEWPKLITFDTAVAAVTLAEGGMPTGNAELIAAWVLETIDKHGWDLDGPAVQPGTVRRYVQSIFDKSELAQFGISTNADGRV